MSRINTVISIQGTWKGGKKHNRNKIHLVFSIRYVYILFEQRWGLYPEIGAIRKQTLAACYRGFCSELPRWEEGYAPAPSLKVRYSPLNLQNKTHNLLSQYKILSPHNILVSWYKMITQPSSKFDTATNLKIEQNNFFTTHGKFKHKNIVLKKKEKKSWHNGIIIRSDQQVVWHFNFDIHR